MVHDPYLSGFSYMLAATTADPLVLYSTLLATDKWTGDGSRPRKPIWEREKELFGPSFQLRYISEILQSACCTFSGAVYGCMFVERVNREEIVYGKLFYTGSERRSFLSRRNCRLLKTCGFVDENAGKGTGNWPCNFTILTRKVDRSLVSVCLLWHFSISFCHVVM